MKKFILFTYLTLGVIGCSDISEKERDRIQYLNARIQEAVKKDVVLNKNMYYTPVDTFKREDELQFKYLPSELKSWFHRHVYITLRESNLLSPNFVDLDSLYFIDEDKLVVIDRIEPDERKAYKYYDIKPDTLDTVICKMPPSKYEFIRGVDSGSLKFMTYKHRYSLYIAKTDLTVTGTRNVTLMKNEHTGLVKVFNIKRYN